MVGRIIKYMRFVKDDSQATLSKKLNIGRSTLSDYEREKTDINFDTLEEIAEECNFEIIFRDKKTQEEISSKNIIRKDIKYEQTRTKINS